MMVSATATKPGVRPKTHADTTTTIKLSRNGSPGTSISTGNCKAVAAPTAIVAIPMRTGTGQERVIVIDRRIMRPPTRRPVHYRRCPEAAQRCVSLRFSLTGAEDGVGLRYDGVTGPFVLD